MMPSQLSAPVSASALVRDGLRVIYWRRWLAAAVWAAVVGAVTIATMRAPRIYEARATVLVEGDEPNVVDFKKVLDEGALLSGYYETQIELLKSRALAQRTVAALGRAGPDLAAAAAAISPAVLSDALRVTQVRGSRTLELRFRSSNPALAAAVLNTHLREYVQRSLENRFEAARQASEWLDAQLAKERTRVEASESALQAYREQHDALSLKNGQDIVVQKLADLNAALTKAKTNRIDKEVQHRDAQALQGNPALLDSFPLILGNAFVQQLKGDLARLEREYAQLSESLGERHPTLIEKRTEVETTRNRLAAEVRRVLQSVEDSYRTAQAEEDSLTHALDEQKRQALLLNRRGIEYAALERDAESVRLVYQSLLQRAKETTVSRELHNTNIQIIDLAEPPTWPVLPRTWMNLSIAVVGGCLVALLAVFGAEALDDRMRTPDDLRRQLALSVLGLLPKAPSAEGERVSVLRADVPPSFIEAVRVIRTAVTNATTENGTTSLLVASADEGAGKTVVAANLAIALAQARERVLLIDADMRRPSVHAVFGCRGEPGLSNLLTGKATLAQALRLTNVPGLTVLAAGTASAEASELLGSPTFAELFAMMQEHFAWVIVDSPPVLTVADATVIAPRTSGVVFVIGCGNTTRREALLALDQLRRANDRVLGAVLNRADLHRHHFYYAEYSSGEHYRADAIGRSA